MQEHTAEGESPHDSTDVDVSAIGDLVKLSLRSDSVNQIVVLDEDDARSLVDEVEAAVDRLE
jgi:hypothetical protein